MTTTTKPDSRQLLRLNELPPQRCGIVRRIENDDEETRRLKTLGICPGRRVELVHPGDPLIVKIFGTRLGLAGALAARVQVEICEPDTCELRETL
ncbi:MAG TPA: FeoA family protein [Verrucomicrobiae bacterium]|nr:FeoA family protein [Verrucomicrobiae bacterium]